MARRTKGGSGSYQHGGHLVARPNKWSPENLQGELHSKAHPTREDGPGLLSQYQGEHPLLLGIGRAVRYRQVAVKASAAILADFGIQMEPVDSIFVMYAGRSQLKRCGKRCDTVLEKYIASREYSPELSTTRQPAELTNFRIVKRIRGHGQNRSAQHEIFRGVVLPSHLYTREALPLLKQRTPKGSNARDIELSVRIGMLDVPDDPAPMWKRVENLRAWQERGRMVETHVELNPLDMLVKSRPDR